MHKYIFDWGEKEDEDGLEKFHLIINLYLTNLSLFVA